MSTSQSNDVRQQPFDWTATCHELPPDSRLEATIRDRGAAIARLWTSPCGDRYVELLVCGARDCLIAYN